MSRDADNQLSTQANKRIRDYQSEKSLATVKVVDKVVDLRVERDTGALGDEVIKMAQALVLCTLPYRPTPDRQTVRSARLSDGSMLKVTFTAAVDGIDLPFGADRHLLAWLFDKAINADTPFVAFRNASEYLRETGKTLSGQRVKELAARIRRLSGLVIGIERRGRDNETSIRRMVENSRLPANLNLEMASAESGQRALPGMEDRFGIQFDEQFFREIKAHHVALPRRIWLELQSHNSGPQMQDLLLFFLYRCYSAQSESIIPWKGLRDQFPQDDSNPWRIRQNVKKAIVLLKAIWPEVQIEARKEGVWVNRSFQQLLPDDPARNRIRRLQ